MNEEGVKTNAKRIIIQTSATFVFLRVYWGELQPLLLSSSSQIHGFHIVFVS